MTTRWLLGSAIAAVVSCASIGGLAEGAPRLRRDDEDRRVFLLESRRLVEENCLISHSSELIDHQRLTPKQWAAEVDKMIGWGAPLPPAESGRIAAYLSESHPTGEPPAVADRRPIAEDLKPVDVSPRVGDAKAGASLFAKGCANCHGLDARGAELGPNLVEKPALLKGAEFQEVVLKGRRRMPASGAVLKPSEVDDILAWLRSLR